MPKSTNPSLKSLVVPWAGLALVAIVATAMTLYTQSNDEVQQQHNLLSQTAQGEFSFQNMKRMITEMKEHYTYEHHEPLFPLSAKDYRGFVCAVLGLMIAAGGGIGGGGILVPIFILVMGFSPKHAIPLSNVSV